jgi:hypothetical protein
VASLNVSFPADQTPIPIVRRDNDNLPPHVKGEVFRLNHNTRHTRKAITTGYYIPQEKTTSGQPEPVKFINNAWYALLINSRDRQYHTRNNLKVPISNVVRAGYWHETDPQHPDYQPIHRTASHTRFCFIPGANDPNDSSEGSSTKSAHSAVSIQSIHEPGSPAIETPTVSIDSVTASFAPVQINPPTETPDIDMSAAATTVAPTHIPSHNGLKGTAPAVFTGDRSRSEAFWNEFRHYRLLNQNNDSINIPFFRVLTALSYIKGPLVEDWVNAQDEELEQCTDPTRPGSIHEDNESLWQEFETAFKATWTDTTKVQSAYSQLMKLQMKDLDIDTYNTTFARLANAAGWEADAKGTIDRYRSGLREAIQCRIINRDSMLDTMEEWQNAARKEVLKVKELQSLGLIGPRLNQTSRDRHSYQNTGQRTHSNSSNSQHIPMDIDATKITTPFKKLTDEERAQYRAEG